MNFIILPYCFFCVIMMPLRSEGVLNMKKICLLICCLLLAFAVSACGGVNTSGMNFETIAEDVTELMYSGKYDKAASYFSENAMEGLDASALEEIAVGTTGTYGNFSGVVFTERSSMDEFITAMDLTETVNPADYPYIVYYQGIEFESGTLALFYMFDPDDRSVVGITVAGMAARPMDEE